LGVIEMTNSKAILLFNEIEKLHDEVYALHRSKIRAARIRFKKPTFVSRKKLSPYIKKWRKLSECYWLDGGRDIDESREVGDHLTDVGYKLIELTGLDLDIEDL